MGQAEKLKIEISEHDRHAHIKAAILEPRWISQHGTFWFLRSNAPKDSTFVFVNPREGVQRPVFDHERLARALKDHGIEASARDLPFSWINVKDDSDIVRFSAGGKSWEWRTNGNLVALDSEVETGDPNVPLKPLSHVDPPVNGSNETKIRFYNKLEAKVSVYWINSLGEEKYYQSVETGHTITQHTYEGHVWRVKRADDGVVIASFAAVAEAKVAIIKEGLQPPKVLKDDVDSTTRSQAKTDGGDYTFVKDNNVWYRDLDGQETKLSTTGTADSPFSNFTHYSPDRKFAVVFQTTPAQDHPVYLVESSPKDQFQPHLKQFQYLKPGDKVQIDRPRMFDLKSKKEIPTDDTLFQNPYKIDPLSADGWNEGSTEFRFVFNQRGHQVLRVVGINTQGKVRALVEETCMTFIDYAHKLYYLELGKYTHEMIWASERDGWNHLYLYDLQSGEVKNRITQGEWVVRSVEYVDEEARRIWIKVFGAVSDQDPYYAHLARVNFDGSDFKILTGGDGSHRWSFSPDRTIFTDTWSRMDMAAKTVARDAESGKELCVVQEGDLKWLLWPIPERFAAPGRDGSTLIHGLIFKPMNMHNGAKYPVIENIYAGPQDFSVPKEYMTHTQAHQLANEGFIVVLIDGMGTNWRSKAFHDVCHKNLRDAGFPDRIAWMRAAASTRSWMDLDRVGVYGSSAGGQSAMGALLFYNDFYSVAIADSGCHDNRMDKLWWNEAWMGYPVDQSYEENSNVVHADKLKGSLMLVVGELDTNVDPASTMQVVNALTKEDKDYDLLFMPGEEHGVGAYSSYAIRKRNEFLHRYLKGKERTR